MTLLEARALCVDRGGRRVIRDLSLGLHAGDGVALVGPNAAGKSTLVRALCGLLPLAAGEVRLDDRPLRAMMREALARAVALVGTEEDDVAPFTVRERVMLGRYPHRGPFGATTREDEAVVEAALERCGLRALADRRIDTLSAGERQRATLARGLAQQPRVLLLDEPSAHLDIGHELQLFSLLDEVRATGVAVLAVVHDLQRAADWAGRMVLLHQGAIVAEGLPESVLLHPTCASAFGVGITAHRAAARILYAFSEASSA
jgi:iron complex transport system ATP-binding protein